MLKTDNSASVKRISG